MSLRVRVVPVLVITCLAIFQTALAQYPARSFGADIGNLTVTVHDTRNQPVADARVEVRIAMGSQLTAAGYTNRSGVFEAMGVRDGQYEIVVQKGVFQATDRADVGAGSGLVAMRIDTSNAQASEVDGSASVSVAQYRVPKKARDEFRKARNLVDERKLDEAQKHLTRALEIHPEYAEALTLRGLMNLESKNTAAAIDDLDHAIKADPSYPLAYVAMGAAFNAAQRYDEALTVLDRGISLAPQSWQGYFEISKAQIGKTNYQAAIHALDKAQSISDGKYPLIHLVKAHAMLALKQYPDAMSELQAFVEQAPKAPQADGARTTLEQVRTYVAKQ